MGIYEALTVAVIAFFFFSSPVHAFVFRSVRLVCLQWVFITPVFGHVLCGGSSAALL